MRYSIHDVHFQMQRIADHHEWATLLQRAMAPDGVIPPEPYDLDDALRRCSNRYLKHIGHNRYADPATRTGTREAARRLRQMNRRKS